MSQSFPNQNSLYVSCLTCPRFLSIYLVTYMGFPNFGTANVLFNVNRHKLLLSWRRTYSASYADNPQVWLTLFWYIEILCLRFVVMQPYSRILPPSIILYSNWFIYWFPLLKLPGLYSKQHCRVHISRLSCGDNVCGWHVLRVYYQSLFMLPAIDSRQMSCVA